MIVMFYVEEKCHLKWHQEPTKNNIIGKQTNKQKGGILLIKFNVIIWGSISVKVSLVL